MPDDVDGFASWLLVPVDDAAASQVVGGKFDDHSVGRKDADVMLPHLATDRGQDLVTVGQLNTKHRIGQGLDHGALQLECAFFLRHKLSNLLRVRVTIRPKMASR